jgi:hypothetical protein
MHIRYFGVRVRRRRVHYTSAHLPKKHLRAYNSAFYVMRRVILIRRRQKAAPRNRFLIARAFYNRCGCFSLGLALFLKRSVAASKFHSSLKFYNKKMLSRASGGSRSFCHSRFFTEHARNFLRATVLIFVIDWRVFNPGNGREMFLTRARARHPRNILFHLCADGLCAGARTARWER